MSRAQTITLLAVFCIPLLLIQTTVSFLDLWSSEENPAYSHGYMVALIALYMYAGNLKLPPLKTSHSKTQLSLYALAIFTFALAWLVAEAVSIQLVSKLALIALLATLTVILIPRGPIWFSAAPALILVFAIQIWDYLGFPIRLISATSVTFLIDLIGIPIFLEDFYITIPEGQFYVDHGCSGLAQFTALLTIVFFYAWYIKATTLKLIAILVAGTILGIISNIIRIFIIIYAGHLTDMQHHFVTEEHITLGWGVFAAISLLFFYFSPRFFEQSPSFSTDNTTTDTQQQVKSSKRLAALTLALIIAFQFLLLKASPTKKENYPSLELQSLSNGWHISNATDSWKPSIFGASASIHKVLQHQKNHSEKVFLHVYFYHSQEQDAEAVGYLNKLSDDNWRVSSSTNANLDTEDKVTQSLLTAAKSNKRVALDWYWINGEITNSSLHAKILNGIYLLLGKPEIARVVIATQLDEAGLTPAQDLLHRFFEDQKEDLSNSLEEYQALLTHTK